ncbi:hypothetical protein QN277_000249 [Acacia crassicarpa]|uniref:SMP-LTD domain-containing protein n=1 Tax=Acacia crassicarpa TaxID=499986 RepID=A0AAE1N4R7_9FABA|nr:hypothetical protein QN277_000249 [Acacia crassicarpa]
MVLVLGLILIGFVLGVLVVVAAEALGVLWITKLIGNKIKQQVESKCLMKGQEIDTRQSLDSSIKKQGEVWILESDKITKFWHDRIPREQKRKKDFVEVSPVKKYGKVTDQSLILTEPDGLCTTIQLKGCIVEAVSAASLSSKKWAKKLPIKVESKTSAIYNGSKIFYIYLETSWEKESWCKALRLASCDQNEKLKWFSQLHEEFHSYLTSLDAEYSSLLKPSVGSSIEAVDRASKPDGIHLKVRQFFKKLSRKTYRGCLDNKSTCSSLSGREEKKNSEKLHAKKDSGLSVNLTKPASAKHYKSSTEDSSPPLSSNQSCSESQSHFYAVDSDENNGIDDGIICWNLLISRLFFDAKGSAELKRFFQAEIQKQLSSTRTPSYIGEVILTEFSTGSIPPCITGVRVLPLEISEVWTLEVDIEYAGGALLGIETRLEVGELDLHKEIEDLNPDLGNAGEVSSDLLEGFEYLGKQLNLTESTRDLHEPKEDGDANIDLSKSFRRSSFSSISGSRWKSMLNSVAKHVSQVPLSLAVRVASLRGTLRIYIKPPPSDQLWFGFTSMPDIDFNLESFIGDRKIPNGRTGSFLIKLLKIGIRENLVLPNCECICIPFMQAEKDDWVPFKVAPFIWTSQTSGIETPNSMGASARTSTDNPEHDQQKPKNAELDLEPANKSTDDQGVQSSSGTEELTPSLFEDEERPQETIDLKEPVSSSIEKLKPQETKDSREAKSPLLHNVISQNIREQMTEDEDDSSSSTPRMSGAVLQRQDTMDETKPLKMGRKDKVKILRRKMSEKFEEKKRHIGEKSRSFVDKMRGSKES